jgi:hypothetical protein
MKKTRASAGKPSSQPAAGLTRREMLQRLILLTGAGLVSTELLTSCRRKGQAERIDEEIDPPFSTWRKLQKILRQSPDHFLARAEALVAAGDARAILSFIGSDLRVIPGGEMRWFDPANSMRWGPAAVLRSGTGTARELAELAVMLLGRVGVSARVKAVSKDRIPAEQLASMLSLRPEVKFAPPWTASERAALRKQLVGPRPKSKMPTTKRLHAEARQLADDVLRQLGPDVAKESRGFSSELSSLPVVEIDFPEGRQIAFTSLPGAPVVSAAQVSTHGVGSPSEPWRVKVTLLGANTRAPKKLDELVSKTWSAPEIIGRQIGIRCLPNLTLEEAAVVTFAGVRTFTPMLTVHGNDLKQEQAVALSAAGEPITVGGEKISVDGNGQLVIDGVALTDSGETDYSAARAVASLQLEVDARAFPELIVRATPRNTAGEIVGGLQARNFAITDQGQAATFLMAANQAAPRIALLVDQSRSMPAEYHGEGASRLLDDLSAEVRRQFPTARLQLLPTDSDLWRWLDIAQSERPDLTIFVTDGDQDGNVREETLARLRQSGPTLFVDAVGDDPSRFKPFLEITGGERVEVSSKAAALQEMATRLSLFKVAPYRFSLSATSTAPEIRQLALAITSRRESTGVRAETTYNVPDAAKRLTPPGICTLAVEIELTRRYESTLTVRRIVAGCDPETERVPNDADLRAVRDAMFGYHLLHVEGGGTTAALRLDAQLESQLSTESLIKAARNGEKIRPHLERGDVVIPAEVLALTGRITDPDLAGIIYEDGMRMVLFGLVPQIGTNRVKRRIDVLPTAVFRSTLEKPDEAFRSTARASAQLALLEAQLFQDSTISALKDRKLVADPSNPEKIGLKYGEDWNRTRALIRTSGLRHSPQRFLIPQGGGGAAWMVNRRSGELFGILNGAGGGEIMESVKRQTAELEAVMTVYAMVFDKMASFGGVPAAGGFALAVVAEYSKTLVKLYAAVSFVLINMNAAGLDEAIREILAEFAENVAKEMFPNVFDDEQIAEDVNAVIAVCYMTTGKKRPGTD